MFGQREELPAVLDLETQNSDTESECNSEDGSHGSEAVEPMEGFEEFDDRVATIMGLSSNSGALDESKLAGAMVHGDNEALPPWHSIDMCMPPTVDAAALALADLKKLLHPSHNGPGKKVASFSALLQKRLTWMEYFL